MNTFQSITFLLYCCFFLLGFSYANKILFDDLSIGNIILLIIVFISTIAFFFKKNKIFAVILLLSAVSFFYVIQQPTAVPLLIEISENLVKIAVPFILYAYVKKSSFYEIPVKSAISATFASHGLLAIGVLTIPENFYRMTITILECDYQLATYFLFVVGLLDVLVAIGLFSKNNKIFNFSVWYCILWGLVTAMARTVYAILEPSTDIYKNGLVETFIRLPNGLLPLALFLYKRSKMYSAESILCEYKMTQGSIIKGDSLN